MCCDRVHEGTAKQRQTYTQQGGESEDRPPAAWCGVAIHRFHGFLIFSRWTVAVADYSRIFN
jgi:hypothetical protein